MSRERNVEALRDFFAIHEVVAVTPQGRLVADVRCRCGWIGGYHPGHLADAAASAGIGSADALTDEAVDYLSVESTSRRNFRAALARAFGQEERNVAAL